MKDPMKISPPPRKRKTPSRSRERVGREPRSKTLMHLINSVKKKREKAMQRRMKYEQKLRATQGGRGILEDSSVKDAQRKDYAKRLSEFYSFVARFDLRISTESDLDEALVDYADYLYLNGCSQDAGNRLRAALEYERPEAVRKGALHLPRFRRALKGWRKMAPNQTRLPMVEYVKSAISGVMLDQGWPLMALFNEVSFSTYARPGELLKIRVCDVVPGVRKGDQDIIILSPFERGEASKTGIFDEVLLLEDVRMPQLGRLMVEESKKREKKFLCEVSMWDFDTKKYLKVWRLWMVRS